MLYYNHFAWCVFAQKIMDISYLVIPVRPVAVQARNDSSVERGEPEIFEFAPLILGWVEGLQLMPVGSMYIFWFLPELAYEDRDMQGFIKPNSTLEFEEELLGIKKDEYTDVVEENPEESGMMDYGSPNYVFYSEF